MTKYLHTNADQAHAWWRVGLCTQCGNQIDNNGCFCRFCSSCTEYWLSDTRKEGNDGHVAREYCPDCQKAEAA